MVTILVALIDALFKGRMVASTSWSTISDFWKDESPTLWKWRNLLAGITILLLVIEWLWLGWAIALVELIMLSSGAEFFLYWILVSEYFFNFKHQGIFNRNGTFMYVYQEGIEFPQEPVWLRYLPIIWFIKVYQRGQYRLKLWEVKFCLLLGVIFSTFVILTM